MATEQAAMNVAEQTAHEAPAVQESLGQTTVSKKPTQKAPTLKIHAAAKASVKKAPANKTTAKKSQATKTTAKKAVTKESAKKKPVAKAAAKKRVAKKPAKKKRITKKRAAKKSPTKKAATMKSAAKKSTPKKSTTKKRKAKKQPVIANKSQAIRDTAKVLGKKARPKDIIAALAEKGITVSHALVGSTLKAAGLRRGRRRRKVEVVVVAPTHSMNGYDFIIDELVKVKKLAAELGGTAKLKELAAAVERLV